MMRALDRVDHLLYLGAIDEITLCFGAVFDDLVDEVLDQIGVKERGPVFPCVAIRRIEVLGDLQLLELNVVGSRGSDRLRNAELLDQAADDRALAAVDPRLDPRVITDRYEAALHGANRTVAELGEEDIAVVDVDPLEFAT